MGTFKTPLLRYFVRIYGHCGLNFNPDWRLTWSNLVNLAINLLLNLIMLYLMAFQDLFAFEEMALALRQSKPLLSLLVSVFLGKLQYMVHFLNVLYFCINGPKIVRLLDAACFRRVYSSVRGAKVLTCCLVAVNSIHFLAIYFRHLLIFLREPKTVLSVSKTACLYIFAFILYHQLVLLLYQQYGYRQYLGLIEKELTEAGNSSLDGMCSFKNTFKQNFFMLVNMAFFRN